MDELISNGICKLVGQTELEVVRTLDEENQERDEGTLDEDINLNPIQMDQMEDYNMTKHNGSFDRTNIDAIEPNDVIKEPNENENTVYNNVCLLYTSPSPRDA